MGKDRKPLGLLALVAVSAILVSAVIAVNADAARGAGRGGGKPSGSSATLTVSPNSVPLGATSVVISGSGFGPNQTVYINTWFLPQPAATADGDGFFSITYSHTFDTPGSGSMEAWVDKGNSMVRLATTTYSVCSEDPCQ